jgi:prepilin-type N-terminal cleavage/methylation domain-containing protein
MRAFTLLELLVVLIIVGIMAGIAIPNYTKTNERAKDREAQTALSLIQSAERIYRLRNPAYYGPTTVLSEINNNLTLSLSSQTWNYSIVAPVNAATFTAQAGRSGASASWARNWTINEAIPKATCSSAASGACPPP